MRDAETFSLILFSWRGKYVLVVRLEWWPTGSCEGNSF